MTDSIGRYMVRSPITVRRNNTAEESLKLMKELNIRHLPVVEKGDVLIGIVSERDLRAATAVATKIPLLVGDVMKTDLLVAKRYSPLADLVEDMAEKKVGSVVVINESNHAVGIFTTTDALIILGSLLRDKEALAMSLDDELFENWLDASPRMSSSLLPSEMV